MPLVSEIGEFGLIGRLRALDIVRGIGDDCAVMAPPPGHDLVMTADALIEGVHFRHEWMPWDWLGAKAMAVNISDIAAMGGQPLGVLLTLGLKRDVTLEDIEAFYQGAARMLRKVDGTIWGGDIVAAPKATSISVTVIGAVPAGGAVLRSGARPGDELWVTGCLGSSAMGLAALQSGSDSREDIPLRFLHLVTPVRVREARAVAGTGHVHAMMDLSDGLAGDLGHMLTESGAGAEIEEALLPVSPVVKRAAARYGLDCHKLALHGGEDYELLMAIEPGKGKELRHLVRQASDAAEKMPDKEPVPIGTTLTRIGRIVEGSGITLIQRDGAAVPLEAKAFTHF